MTPDEYVALGDSVSIDLYPALDLGETDVAVALERDPHAGNVAPLGAAALLYRNADDRWPEFVGDDLATRHPAMRFTSLAEDGATIGDVFGAQLPEVVPSDAETLVTLTIGGNDLLSAVGNQPKEALLARIVRDIGDAYHQLVRSILEARPRATILLATIYDPSDRSGRIPGVLDFAGPLPLRYLDALNERIREVAGGAPRARRADVYAHFLGHGVSAPPEDCWYWRRSLIEPSAVGASEVRRVWLEALA
ncbi:MAG TPA: SGNH/GDSL hydrolase family protein [Gemmatimonadaceae bacterium]|nr:SGNH/GDSL hydrolase family protein [Gemmatimonadaceae bacterium]